MLSAHLTAGFGRQHHFETKISNRKVLEALASGEVNFDPYLISACPYLAPWGGSGFAVSLQPSASTHRGSAQRCVCDCLGGGEREKRKEQRRAREEGERNVRSNGNSLRNFAGRSARGRADKQEKKKKRIRE